MVSHEEIKGKVVEVIRNTGRVIVMRVIIEDMVFNSSVYVISAFAPQVGCEESQNKELFFLEYFNLSKTAKTTGSKVKLG